MNTLKHLGSRDTRWQRPDVWEPCTYANEGERLIVNVGEPKGLIGVVICAAGYHVRVELDGDNGKRWVNVADCARRVTKAGW